MVTGDLDKILLKVQKPARYTGNELNMAVKDPDSIKTRFALCFPDIYEIGMSHLGSRILYHILNRIEGVYCERAYAPWPDMESELEANDMKLFSTETKRPLSGFDIVGFTLQYEMSYTNVLNMLRLSGIPILSSERTDNDPLVTAGGPCAFNPEPLSDFIDFFVLGDGEEVIKEIMTSYGKHMDNGGTRRGFLDAVRRIEGVYVPSFGKTNVKRRILGDLDGAEFPVEAMVPFIQITHDRAFLEISRGCIRGCRFCQAGYVYRPVREKAVGTLVRQACDIIGSTGYEEISLGSLSAGDHSRIRDLTMKLTDAMRDKRVTISLPSLRADTFSLDLMKTIGNDRKTGLTFAPEAGTERLRTVINKGIGEKEMLDAADAAFRSGYRTIKLYFMLGLPTETMDDVDGIIDIVNKIIRLYMDINGTKNGLCINVSTALFVPKPFTPFQWEKQESKEGYLAKVDHLKKKFDRKAVSYSWHDYETSLLEALFARGGKDAGKVLLNAFEKGCRFDAWNEYFDFDKWTEACREAGIDPYAYVSAEKDICSPLPWDFIDIGIDRSYFVSERERAYDVLPTVNCRDGCSGCGLLELQLGECVK